MKTSSLEKILLCNGYCLLLICLKYDAKMKDRQESNQPYSYLDLLNTTMSVSCLRPPHLSVRSEPSSK